MTDETSKPESSQVIRDRVLDRLDELIEPKVIETKRWEHEAGVDHLVPHSTRVAMPPLVEQLGTTMPGSTAGSSSGTPDSRPPGSLEAADALRTMSREAKAMAAHMLALWTERNIPGVQTQVRPRRLVDALRIVRQFVPELDRDSLTFVDSTVRRWWVQARIATTWDAPPPRPYAPCPACGVRSKLRVVLDPPAMLCLACGESWEGTTISDLGAAYEAATRP